MRETFILYTHWESAISSMSDKDAGELLKAIFAYRNDKKIKLSKHLLPIFELIKNQFRVDDKKYERILERNRINGSKGGRPKKPKKPTGLSGFPKKPKQTQKKLNENENENDLKKINKKNKNFLKTHTQEIINEAKEKYPDKNCNKAMTDFLEYLEIHGKTYKDYRLAFFKWVRDDRFNQYRSVRPRTIPLDKVLNPDTKNIKPDVLELSDDQKEASKRYRDMMKNRGVIKTMSST